MYFGGYHYHSIKHSKRLCDHHYLPLAIMRITTKSIHESITFCNRAATHFSILQTVCSTASYLSVWPTKKGAEAPHYFYDYTKKLLKDTQPNAEPACGYIKSKGPDLQSSCCRCSPQLLLITALAARTRHSSCSSQSFLLLMMQEWLIPTLPSVKKR